MLDLSPPNLLNQTSLPFRDASGCKAWLSTLPLTDVPRAHTAVEEVVDSLNLTELSGFERLKIMELIRDKVAFLQDSVVAGFAGKPLPLSNKNLDVWEGADTLWQRMQQGYRYCLSKVANGDEATSKHFALIVERCLRYTGLQILHHGLIHREVPERLLEDLHALFHYARKRGVDDVKVKDSLDGYRGVATPMQAYVRALLIDAARVSLLTQNELMAVDALLKRWAAKVVISQLPPVGNNGALRCTNLTGARGLWKPHKDATESEGMIFLDLRDVSESLRRRIRKLAAGTPSSELNLPPAFAHVAAAPLLGHLYRAWCEGSSQEPLSQPMRESCEVAASFDVLYHSLAGKPFEVPRQLEELGMLEAQQLAVFGKVTNRAPVESVVTASPVEAWEIEGIGADHIRMRYPAGGKVSVALQQLIGYRRASMSSYELGVIRGLTDQSTAGILVELSPLPGGNQPEAVIVRSKDTTFIAAFRLHPADTSAPMSLLLPCGVYQQGKVMEVRSDLIHMYRLKGLTQRGVNFDWVSCEAL